MIVADQNTKIYFIYMTLRKQKAFKIKEFFENNEKLNPNPFLSEIFVFIIDLT